MDKGVPERRSVASGKAATMDSCAEIKILLIKNERKKKQKRQTEKEKRNFISYYCYLKEAEIRERTKEQNLKIKVFYTFKSMEK